MDKISLQSTPAWEHSIAMKTQLMRIVSQPIVGLPMATSVSLHGNASLKKGGFLSIKIEDARPRQDATPAPNTGAAPDDNIPF